MIRSILLGLLIFSWITPVETAAVLSGVANAGVFQQNSSLTSTSMAIVNWPLNVEEFSMVSVLFHLCY